MNPIRAIRDSFARLVTAVNRLASSFEALADDADSLIVGRVTHEETPELPAPEANGNGHSRKRVTAKS